MTVNTEIKLAQPPVAYGAVFGRNQDKQNRRYVIFAGFVLVWLASVAFIIAGNVNPELQGSSEEFSFFGLAMFIAIAMLVVGFFGGLSAVFSYNDEVYAYDIYRNRAEYAKTVFREWFEDRYGVRITPSDALSLMDGGRIRITRKNDDGRFEAVNVRFSDTPGFLDLAMKGSRPNDEEFYHEREWNLVDVSTINFQLLVIEEPDRPRVYLWV